MEKTRRPVRRKSRSALIRRYLLTALIVAGAAAAVLFFARSRKYSGYRVLRTERQEDTSSSRYGNLNGYILQYGTDGARLRDRQGEELWNVSFSMKDPQLVTCRNTAAVFDKNGTTVVVLDRDGKRGEFTAGQPLFKACVSEEGNVAVIQEDDSNAWIEYYSQSGTRIASVKTSMDNPGYPLGLGLSPDGELMAVSYLSFKDGIQKGIVHIYSFGSAGQNQMDNRIGAFEFSQRIVPEVDFLDNKTLAVFRDNGFTLYEGAKVPKAVKDVNFDREICSVFHDDSHIGLILTGKEEDTWEICLYNRSGRQLFSGTTDFPYSVAELYGGEISLYNQAALRVYNLDGKVRFDGTLEPEPREVFAIGKHRYAAVGELGVDVIQLTGR